MIGDDAGPDDVLGVERPVGGQDLLQAAVVALVDAVVVQEVVVEASDVEGVSLALGGLGRVSRPGHPLVAVGLHGHAPVLHPRAPSARSGRSG